jgi:hypothetical protein
LNAKRLFLAAMRAKISRTKKITLIDYEYKTENISFAGYPELLLPDLSGALGHV